MINHSVYDYFALCILNKNPKLIEYIPINSKDKKILSIILDSIDFEKDCIIVDYIIVNHPNYINNLLDKNDHKNHKPLLKYILHKKSELITDIKK